MLMRLLRVRRGFFMFSGEWKVVKFFIWYLLANLYKTENFRNPTVNFRTLGTTLFVHPRHKFWFYLVEFVLRIWIVFSGGSSARKSEKLSKLIRCNKCAVLPGTTWHCTRNFWVIRRNRGFRYCFLSGQLNRRVIHENSQSRLETKDFSST